MWNPEQNKRNRGIFRRHPPWNTQPSSKATEKEWKGKPKTNHSTITIEENTDHINYSQVLSRWIKHIPLSQRAYQSGRSTTEQVFAIKTLAEKAITSKNCDIFLLLLDMPNTFDTVERKKLTNLLSSILTKCKLHIMDVLINDVILNVKFENKTGPDIHTHIGIHQGDWISPVYLVSCLSSWTATTCHLCYWLS